jgi:hypothetical protein
VMTPSSCDGSIAGGRSWRDPAMLSPKTKKPAAGGGAAGFRKKPNDSWEEECCHSTDDPGRRMGRLYIEGCGRRCIASIEIIILISCSVDRHFFAGQLCVMRKAGGSIALIPPCRKHKSKAPAREEAGAGMVLKMLGLSCR